MYGDEPACAWDCMSKKLSREALAIFVVPSAALEIRQYIDREGRNRFDRWFMKPDDVIPVRISVALDRLERGSSTAKGVGAGVQRLWREEKQRKRSNDAIN